MIKLIFKIISFSFIVFGIYILSVFVLSKVIVKNTPIIVYVSNYYPVKGGHSYQSFMEFSKETGFDIVFLGSSHAYRGFDPRIFKKHGYHSFNLGTSGQNLESSEMLLKRLVNEKGVSTVVLEIYCRQFEDNENATESAFDIALNAPKSDLCFDYIKEKRDWRFVNLFFYKLFTSTNEAVYKDTTYVGNGYSERKDSALHHEFKYANTFAPSIKKLQTLERIIKFLNKNNRQLILVSHPLPHEFPENVHYRFKEFIKPLLAKHNIPYFDYTINHTLASKFNFYDYNHMNQSGVQIFDSILIHNEDFKHLINEKRN